MSVAAAGKAAEPVLGALDDGRDPRRPAMAKAGTPTLRAALDYSCANWLDREVLALTKAEVRGLHDRLAGKSSWQTSCCGF